MATSELSPGERDRRLDEAIAGYLRLQAIGQAPDPGQWLAKFPDLADELSEFLQGSAEVNAIFQCVSGESRSSRASETFVGAEPAARDPGRAAKVDVGSRLDTYELLEKLGEGGMGTVWKARHVKLDKCVAIKLLPPHLTSDPESIHRFEREMRAVGRVEHPNVVRAMDAGEVAGLHYLVMEYVDGVDLCTYVRTRGPRSPMDACRMLRQAALGLAAAHAHGMIHRDIKPSNLLLTKQGQVKILDLGLARLVTDAPEARQLTRVGQVLGTPDYMAPEQWGDTRTVDQRTDLYALGCTLCFLLTGRAPYGDDGHTTIGAKMKGHVLEPIPRLRDLRADVTEELDNLYCQLTAKDPVQRPASAAGIAERFKEITQRLTSPTAVCGANQPAPVEPKSLDEAAAVTEAGACVRTMPVADATPVMVRVRPRARSSSPPPNGRRRQVLVAAGGAASLLFGVIIIIVMNKDGTKTELRVPGEGAQSVEVQQNGKTVAKVDLARAASDQPLAGTRSPDRPATVATGDAPPLAVAPFDAKRAFEFQTAWATYLGVPVEFTNSIGMKFRLIPPGEFMMGLTRQEAEEMAAKDRDIETAALSCAPQHRERLTESFYVSAHEVTQEQYEGLTGMNPAFFSALGSGKAKVAGQDTIDHPVDSVHFLMAADFCNRLSVKEHRKPVYILSNDALTFMPGDGYRLPTAAEWEWACRAGTSTAWFHGNREETLGSVAWFARNSGDATHKVGQLKGNAFGLFDMLGNVAEWCHDLPAPQTYSRDTEGHPQGKMPSGLCLRGGRWSGTPDNCHAGLPSRIPFLSQSYNTGFRVIVGVSASQRKG